MQLGSMHPVERVIRGILGVGLLGVYFILSPGPAWALLGVIPLATAVLGFCPMYALCRWRLVTAEGPAATDHVQARQAVPESDPGEAVDEDTSDAEPEASPDPPRPARRAAASHSRAKRGRKKAGSRGKRGGRSAARGRGTKKPAPAAPAKGQVIHATDATFDSLVLGTDQPVLVDFWAEWCGPCKAIAPVLDELAREFAGKARIVKVDVDSCSRAAGQFNIRSIPTLILLKDGDVADVLVGVQSKAKLAKILGRASR